MGISQDYAHIIETVRIYQSKLQAIKIGNWKRTPPIGGWSYAEVYFHIFDASILTLAQLTASAKGDGKLRPTAFFVKMILFFGTLPPGIKYKAPKMLTERLKMLSPADTAALADAFLLQLTAAYSLLPNADLAIKTPHPRMGYLNSHQWLRFIRIHLDHHLKQLIRIDNSF